jgi:hypothetical protein
MTRPARRRAASSASTSIGAAAAASATECPSCAICVESWTTCFRITPENATLLWTYEPADKEGMKFISPAIVGGYVFFGHQKVSMVELSSGKVVATSAKRNSILPEIRKPTTTAGAPGRWARTSAGR